MWFLRFRLAMKFNKGCRILVVKSFLVPIICKEKVETTSSKAPEKQRSESQECIFPNLILGSLKTFLGLVGPSILETSRQFCYSQTCLRVPEF